MEENSTLLQDDSGCLEKGSEPVTNLSTDDVLSPTLIECCRQALGSVQAEQQEENGEQTQSENESESERIIRSLFNDTLLKIPHTLLKGFFTAINNQLQSKDATIRELDILHSSTKQQLEDHINERVVLERRIAELHDVLKQKTNEIEEERQHTMSETLLAEEKLRKHDEAAKRAIQQFQQDVNLKLMEASKQVESIRRERESAVMRFAQAEQQVVDFKVAAEKFENQSKMAMKERDFFQERIKMLTDERKKMQNFLDQKTMEVTQMQKETNSAKEVAKEADAKMKQSQAKAKADQDILQEMRVRFERSQQQLIAMRDELEQTKQTLTDKEKSHLKEKTESEQQIQQENFQQRMELAEINERFRYELDSLKQKHRDTLEENITFRDRITCLEAELRKCQEELTVEKNEKFSLKDRTEEAVEEANAARERAAELVEHNEKLSLFRSQIQAEMSGLRENLSDLQRDYRSAVEENNSLKTESSTLLAQLAEERRTHSTVIEQLKCELSGIQSSSADLKSKLAEQESLVISSRRKYHREVKELQRQLRGQQAQHSSEHHLIDVNSTGRGLSRASSHNSDLDMHHHNSSSSSSLKNGTEQQQQQQRSPPYSDVGQAPTPVDVPPVAYTSDHQVAVIVGGSQEVSRQQILERLVGLQRALAKKSEKVDFLNEQVRQLMEEVQKKSRIVQVLATRESAETGAFLSDKMDRHKAAMAKKAGIMASVLSSELHDGKMTLELSLEISRKLQEVLEETLLKNIMLKESLDTLGHEISHLSKENRDLKLTLKGVLEEIPGGRKN